MNKTTKILAVFLVVQIVLLAARAFWPASESKASGEALLTNFDPGAVTQLRITDSSGNQVVLKKDGDNWVLPDYGDYPVNGTTVSLLLGKIKALTTERLIARSTTSQRRLKVSSDTFERLIEIEAGNTTHKLYLGEISSGNTIHVRLDDQSQIYLVGNLSSQDANAHATSWIDTVYFTVPSDQVVSLSLQNANGTFEFTKNGDSWTMTGLAPDETLSQNNLTTLLNQVTSLRMTAPIGKDLQDTFGLDAPQATITVRVLVPVETPAPAPTPETGLAPLVTPTSAPATPEPTATPQLVEKEYTLQIGAAQDDGVVVKSSESAYYVLVTTGSANNFIQKTRADFIALPPTPTPEPSPMSTPEASATPAAPSTPEATTTPAAETSVPATATPESGSGS
jgi:hypothetical protein